MKLAENFVLQITLNVYLLFYLGTRNPITWWKVMKSRFMELKCFRGKRPPTKYYNYHAVVWTWNISRIGSFGNVGIELYYMLLLIQNLSVRNKNKLIFQTSQLLFLPATTTLVAYNSEVYDQNMSHESFG